MRFAAASTPWKGFVRQTTATRWQTAWFTARDIQALGRMDEGKAHALEALHAARDAQSENHLLLSLQHLAAVAALSRSDLLRAAQLSGFVEARFARSQWKRDDSAQQERDRLLSLLGDEIPDLDALMTAGSRWSEDKAIAEALSL